MKYDDKTKKQFGTADKMTVADDKSMAEERMRTKLRYQTTPQKKAKAKLGKEYM
jgi:hypothetical protein